MHAKAAHLPMLVDVLDRNLRLIERTVAGIDHAGAYARLVDDGSHLHWLLGHLVASRDGLLERLGLARVWDTDAGAAFGFGSSPDAPVSATIAEQVGRLRAQQERIATASLELDDEALAREAGRMTIGGWIEFLVWHETYHVGQATLYRRAAGLASVIG